MTNEIVKELEWFSSPFPGGVRARTMDASLVTKLETLGMSFLETFIYIPNVRTQNKVTKFL